MARGRKLDEVVLQYTDEEGKKRKIRIRTTELDAILFSSELTKKIRPLLKTEPIPPDPEEPIEELHAATAMTADGDPSVGGPDDDDDDDGFKTCYVIDGVLICPP